MAKFPENLVARSHVVVLWKGGDVLLFFVRNLRRQTPCIDRRQIGVNEYIVQNCWSQLHYECILYRMQLKKIAIILNSCAEEEFSQTLANQQDQQQASYVLQGLQHSFKLGFQPVHRLKSAKKKFKTSALQHPKVMHEYLANEVSLGRVVGPFSSPHIPHLHISSFG